ncbi:MAG TPA: LysR family transcriptional regulator [Telluria sp.]|nr:LysR family transcriptional regulator [Telluria sp.]
MEWDDIRFFLALAREGSLTGAARALKVEHSTIARRVSNLEAALGLRLFDRLPRGWRPTAEGEAMAAQAQRIEDEALAFERAASGAADLRGPVRISVPPAVAAAFLAPRLGGLRTAFPGIALELAGETQLASLTRREADIALRLSRPNAPDLVVRALGELGFGLYAAADWHTRPENVWEFIGYDQALSETPQQLWLEEFAGTRPFVLRANDLLAQREAARAGVGIALLPHFLAHGVRQLKRLREAPCPVLRTIWLVMHGDVRRSPRVRAVADALAEIVLREAPLLRGPV